MGASAKREMKATAFKSDKKKEDRGGPVRFSHGTNRNIGAQFAMLWSAMPCQVIWRGAAGLGGRREQRSGQGASLACKKIAALFTLQVCRPSREGLGGGFFNNATASRAACERDIASRLLRSLPIDAFVHCDA